MAEFQPGKSTDLFQLTFEGSWPTSVAFLGANDRLAAANQKGEIYLWELPAEPGEEPPPPVRRLDGHENGVTNLRVTSDGKTLISSSLDHTVRLWDPDASPSGEAEVVMDIKSREAEAKKARSDEPLKRPGVKVDTLEAQHVLEGHGDWVKGLNLSGDGRRLISGDDDCRTIVWDFASRKEIASWTGYPDDWVTSAALSPDGKIAFVAEYSSSRGSFDRPPAQARFFNADDGSEILDVLKVQFPDVKVRDNSYGYATKWGKFVARGFVCAQFSPDGKLLAVGQGGETGTGKVHLIEVETGKLVRSVSGHRYGVADLCFTADGKHVLSCGRDTMVRICQVEDGKEVGTLGKSRGGQFKDILYAVALSPDQTHVAAADIAGLVHVWRLGG